MQHLPDALLFGAQSEEQTRGARLRRAARYPVALLRDLAGGKLTLHAMGLVYTSLLAIIPLLAFSFGILKAFHAQGVLEPLVHEFFSPMGSAADEFTARVMDFANKVRGDLVGSLGLVLLIYTLIGTMQKVEDGFNFVWHVDVPRSFARRMSEYLTLLVTGPLLLGALIGLSHLAASSVPVKLLSELPLFDRVLALSVNLAPFVVVSALLTALYVMIPNTRVRLGPALVGGVCAGIVWSAIGRFFTSFVVYSTRLTVVYAGLAIIIAALVWTYFGWTILLLGAQLSLYIQNPAYLRSGIREPRLSSVDIERLALGIMYLIAIRQRYGGARDTIASLALRLDFPGIAVARVCAGLEHAGYIVPADNQTLVLGCDAAQVRVLDILVTARTQRSGLIRRAAATPAAVEAFCDDIDRNCEQRCAGLTLAALIASKPGPVGPGSLTGDGQGLDQH